MTTFRKHQRRIGRVIVGCCVVTVTAGQPALGASDPQVAAAKRYAAQRALFVAGPVDQAIPAQLLRSTNGSTLALAPDLRLRRRIASALLNVAPTSRPTTVDVTVVRTIDVDAGVAEVWVNAVAMAQTRTGQTTSVPEELVVRVDHAGTVVGVSAPPSEFAPSTEPATGRPPTPDRSWMLAEAAWTPAGRPGIWVSRPYWGAASDAALTRLARSPQATACAVIPRRLAAIRSAYFDWSPVGSETTRFCVRVGALRRDGRLSEFLAAARRSARDRSLPMVLPRPGGNWPRRAPAAWYFRTSDPVPTRATMGSFDRNATYTYAEKWWATFNPQYDKMVGNDCTNYVSQLLRSGGFHKTPGWFQNWSPQQGFTWTVTWVRARALRNWLLSTGRVTRTDRWGVWRGDVLMYDFQSDGIIDHTSMVTWRARNWSVLGRPVGWPLVTQHSRHYLWRSTYLQIAGDPDAVIGYYKIHSTT